MAPKPPSEESGEDRLIARFFKPLATHPGALGLTDDAAFLTPPEGHDIVLKTDTIVGGVHFFADDPPGAIARKALRVNLSDLAAKGAQPLGFLLSLAIPSSVDEKWLQAFSDGLHLDSEAFHCPLFGGDTDRTPGPVTVAIFAVGSVPEGAMVRRSGAKPGDRIVVTGSIGDAALGLALRRDRARAAALKLSDKDRMHLLERYLIPEPRMGAAAVVLAHASAAMDVSDGLAGDLAKLCRVSGVSADVDVSRVPLSAAAKAALATDESLIETILTGGDDYEILCAVPASKVEPFRAALTAQAIAATEIGEVVAGDAPPRFLAGGKALSFKRTSFSHF